MFTVGIQIIVRSKFGRFFPSLFESNATRLCNTRENVFTFDIVRIMLYYYHEFSARSVTNNDICTLSTYGP